MTKPIYKRIVLKLSGEALAGKQTHGIDPEVLLAISRQIKEIRDLSVDVAVVLGAGNILRGRENTACRGLDLDRSVADYMGMLATVINGLSLQDALEKTGDDQLKSMIVKLVENPGTKENLKKFKNIIAQYNGLETLTSLLGQ